MELEISVSLLIAAIEIMNLVGIAFMGWLMMPTMRLMMYMKKHHLEFDAETYLSMITRKK
ncbi:MAG: hypothetical protein M1595_00465 [Candidatus Thermoplasmatota archaeon]|nr:hypothetical protein [Candidatus Thermoplasmatota archaeon]